MCINSIWIFFRGTQSGPSLEACGMTNPESTPPWDLYHRIADPASAAVRSKLVEVAVTDRVRFRNIDASETAQADLRALTGSVEVPVLKVSEKKILSGGAAILAWLDGPR